MENFFVWRAILVFLTITCQTRLLIGFHQYFGLFRCTACPFSPILVSRSLLLPLPFSLTIRTLPSNDPVCLEAGYTDFSAEMCGISIMMLKFFWNRIPLQICATIRAVFFMIIHVSSRPSLIGFGSVCLLKWHFFLIENAVPVKTPITSD